MKHIFLFIFISFFVYSIKSQTAEDFTIQGNLVNEKNKVFIHNYENSDTITVSESGGFSYNLKISKPQFLYFISDSYSEPICIFAFPGDVVDISYNVSDFKNSLKITSTKNQKYVDYLLNQDFGVSYDSLSELYSNRDLKEVSFPFSVDSYYKSNLDKYNMFLQSDENLSVDFIELESARLKFYYAALYIKSAQKLSEKYNYYENLGKVIDSFTVANKLDIFYGSEEYLQLNSFRSLLYALVNVKTFSIKETDYADNDELYHSYENAGYNYIKTNFPNSRISSLLIYNHIKFWLPYVSIDFLKNKIEEFLSSSADEIFKNQIRKKYESLVNFKLGSPAPDFTLNDINGNSVSLSNFKNKVVFIDFWAYWCGPCKYETPFMAELEEQYEKDTNIVFISLSTDPRIPEWKDYIKNNQMKGILIIDNTDENVSSVYKVKYIPKFVIIDKQGNLNNLEAPRPSQKKELTSILDKLIKE